ncbi:MAG: hypothetical protein ABL309_11480 [Phycisphaerales bacterium]
MHTATKQPSETDNTNTQSAEEVLAQLKTIYRIKRLESEVTMVAAQTKAMETLITCMTPIKSTGDTKLDAFYARERNRQRLAAIQTLLHIRTVQREKRLRRAARVKAKAKAERLEPNRASDGSQATKKEMPAPPAPSKGGVVRSEADGHVDNGSSATPPVPSPLASEGGRERDRMRRRPEPSDRPNADAPPPPQPAPPMHPHNARVQELRRLRAEKMARRQAEALDAEQNAPEGPKSPRSGQSGI